jgi:hypothetical protein
MPNALQTARSRLVAVTVDVYHHAHHEAQPTPRLLAIGKAADDLLHEVELALMEAERPALPPDEEGVSLCQPG